MIVSGDRAVGIAYVGLGAGAAFLARGYGMGTVNEIGPGVFPLCLGIALAILGMILIVMPAQTEETDQEYRALLRPACFVFGSVVLFALLLAPAGLLISAFLLVVTSSMADRTAGWTSTFASGVGLTLFAWAVFSLGLGIPLPLFPDLAWG